MHAAELGLRGSWRHQELRCRSHRPPAGAGQVLAPGHSPSPVTAALEDPSLGPPGWRPTTWSAPEDSQDGQGQGACRWSPHGPLSGFLVARFTLLTREPACAPHHSPPPSSSPRGARCLPPLQTLSGDPGGLQDVSLYLQPCHSRRRQEPGLLLVNVSESKREAVWGPDASRWVWVAASRRGLRPGPGAPRAAVPQGSH